jgi:hypothetical protein
MSGAARQVGREQMKAAYRQFKKMWGAERAKRAARPEKAPSPAEAALLVMESGKSPGASPVPEPRLGKCPPFRVWAKSVRARTEAVFAEIAAQEAAKAAAKKVEVDSTEW